MKHRANTFLGLSAIVLCWAGSLPAQQIDVYFSPRGGCTAAICKQIAEAKSTILVQAYNLTSAPITRELLAAHARGVKVAIIVDPSQQNPHVSTAFALHAAGIQLFTDRVEKIHHNKVIIIDDHLVITGSFNFTTNAELHNAENLLLITDKKTAAAFAANWQFHKQHSQPFSPQPGERKKQTTPPQRSR